LPSTCPLARCTFAPPAPSPPTRSTQWLCGSSPSAATLTEAYPKPLTKDVVHAADVIVTMGCGDACPICPGKRYLDWDSADPNDQPIDRVRDIRDDLQARITALLRDLNI
jgi:protein-tyrosine-phosphatase